MVFETNRADGVINNLSLLIFYAFILVFAYILHRYLFDWKPKAYETYSKDQGPQPGEAISDKVIVIVVDGMRKERFYEANTPF